MHVRINLVVHKVELWTTNDKINVSLPLEWRLKPENPQKNVAD